MWTRNFHARKSVRKIREIRLHRVKATFHTSVQLVRVVIAKSFARRDERRGYAWSMRLFIFVVYFYRESSSRQAGRIRGGERIVIDTAAENIAHEEGTAAGNSKAIVTFTGIALSEEILRSSLPRVSLASSGKLWILTYAHDTFYIRA